MLVRYRVAVTARTRLPAMDAEFGRQFEATAWHPAPPPENENEMDETNTMEMAE